MCVYAFKINIRGLDRWIPTVFQSAIKISFVCWMLFISNYERVCRIYQEYVRSNISGVCASNFNAMKLDEVNHRYCMIRITLDRPCSRPLTENKCTDCLPAVTVWSYRKEFTDEFYTRFRINKGRMPVVHCIEAIKRTNVFFNLSACF